MVIKIKNLSICYKKQILEREINYLKVKLYNTLTKQKEEFIPLEGNTARIYTCGPTVYSYAHIGNFRAYIFMDTLRRVLKFNGYNLKHVLNITDVGHLESDADEGEDKMMKAAKKENKDPFEIAKHYTDIFLRDMGRLNIDKPEIIAKATDHIQEMIEFISQILKNGYGYETSKGIYFDISKLDKYPILSNRNIDEQIAGARVEVDPEKRNPHDFVLWIKAPKEHIMKWESPWGLCYPGWHIECSAMGRKYLGETFDIHTGGIDHIPTHHENEIAQSKGATGKVPAKIWMHCEFITVDGGKMSKSLGNTYTLDQLEERGIPALAYKLFCFTSHYRNKINFTFEVVEAAKTSLNRLKEGYLKHKEGTGEIEEQTIQEYLNKFTEAINDDLNMPVAMSVVWDVIRNPIKSKKLAKLLLKFDEVLGLEIDKINQDEEVPTEVLNLLEQRKIAREKKDWAESDRLRDEIIKLGYKVKDSKEGTSIERD